MVEASALALAWVLLQGRVGAESPAGGPRKVEDHILEAVAVPVEEQLLWELVREDNKHIHIIMITSWQPFRVMELNINVPLACKSLMQLQLRRIFNTLGQAQGPDATRLAF